MENPGPRAAVFLDRDGTLIEDCGNLSDSSGILLFPDTVPALRGLQDEFLLFIVTNQSGVAKGAITLEDVERVNASLVDTLAGAGVEIMSVYVCPHQRSDDCECIKPKPHFLKRAAREFNVDLSRSFTVGDHPHDVELARNAGARGVYVKTGHGMKHLHELPPGAIVAPGIREAAAWILAVHSGTASLEVAT